jgi:hypothetical protein
MLRNGISILGLVIFAAIAPTHSSAAPTPAPAQKMKDCLLLEDGYKERLDCYDAIIKPEPKAGAKKAKTASECRFLKEEDERLACYNGFVAPKAKPPAAQTAKTTKTTKNPPSPNPPASNPVFANPPASK